MAANTRSMPTRWLTTSRTFHSVHGVGAFHCSGRTSAIRSPTDSDARARSSTETVVIRGDYGVICQAAHGFRVGAEALSYRDTARSLSIDEWHLSQVPPPPTKINDDEPTALPSTPAEDAVGSR